MHVGPLEDPHRSLARRAIGALVVIAWTAVRLPLLALLIVMEPLICGALWLFATFGILSALFWHFLVHEPRFPFWPAIGLSIGAALLAGIYVGIIRLLGGSHD